MADQQRQRSSQQGAPNLSNNINKHNYRPTIIPSSKVRLESIMVGMLFGCMCFYAGLLVGTASSSNTATSSTLSMLSNFTGTLTTALTPEMESIIGQRVREQVRKVRRLMNRKLNTGSITTTATSSDTASRFPPNIADIAVGMALVDRDKFAEKFDMGVPLDPSSTANNQVLLLYQGQPSLPDHDMYVQSEATHQTTIPLIENIDDAVANCDQLHIVLSDHNPRKRRQCTAIMGQYEAFHIQKFMRLPPEDQLPDIPELILNETTGETESDAAAEEAALAAILQKVKSRKLDANLPLRYVNRGAQTNGRISTKSPKEADMKAFWGTLVTYLSSIEDVLGRLKYITEKIVKNNTIIVLVCNFGQSELLLNFICNAQRRNLDLSSVLVFATDEETRDLVAAMGVAVFYDEENYGNMPKRAARRYADPTFTKMMMAKVFCVHMTLMLGYNVLFQDVDVIWYKHPFEYFFSTNSTIASKHYDMYFQDDGNHALFYAPYSANTGFYFVRNNPKTRHFFNSFLLQGDLIHSSHSHQVPLVALLQEHASMFALKIKIFPREEDEFPGGHAFHRRKGFMKQLIKGNVQPYIFHMSWTKSKINKVKFFQQFGEWFVRDSCIQKTTTQLAEIVDTSSGGISAGCCSPQILFTCHYSDKPSIRPCNEMPPIDNFGRSWW